MGTSSGFLGQKLMLSSDTWSVRSGRAGLRTYEAKSDFTALSSDLEFTQHVGSMYGSVSEFRVELKHVHSAVFDL